MERKDAEALLNQIMETRIHDINVSVSGISKGEQYVLFYLYTTKDHLVNAGEIAKALEVSTARVAAILNSLVKKEYVYKLKNPKDSRMTIVSLSKKGNEYIADCKEQAIDNIILINEKIGENDFNEFLRIANKIKSVLK